MPAYTARPHGSFSFTSTVTEAIPLGTARPCHPSNLSASAGPTVIEDAGAPPSGGALRLQLFGTWVGTVAFEVRMPGPGTQGWVPASAVPIAGGSGVASATANGVWLIDAVGLEVRLNFTRTSGTLEGVARPVGA